MRHIHHYSVKAQTHFELGLKLAHQFKTSFFEKYNTVLTDGSIQKNALIHAQQYSLLAELHFPQYIEELKGYAQGVGVDFEVLWYLYLRDDLIAPTDKCTSVYSSDGLIIGHNEDNCDNLTDRITVLEKTIGDISILELHYHNSIGGDVCSVNSHGYVQTINTLHHVDNQVGVPRNIIARWLSETKNPAADFELMQHIPRNAGYSHTFSNLQGKVVNIEATAKKSYLTEISGSFVHTNHYLSSLSEIENISHPGNSRERKKHAESLVNTVHTPSDMMQLLEQVTLLESNDTRESKTLARMVFDLKNKAVWSWLQRENSLGWVQYPLTFL